MILRVIRTGLVNIWGVLSNYTILLICFSFFQVATLSGQEPISISKEYSQAPLEKVLLDLEKQIGYDFFYLKEWVKEDTINAAMAALPLPSVLDIVLDATNLNYYILEDERRIFLLENTIVYDQLPKNFFKKELADSTGLGEGKQLGTSPAMVFNRCRLPQMRNPKNTYNGQRKAPDQYFGPTL